MGLIKAGIGALGGTLADQWKEFFYCDALPNDVLMRRGQKQITGRSSNTKGNDNIISNGSGIAVADGQCMIIVDQGKIVEVCAEPGEYTFDTSSEPSIFSGKFGESLKESFRTLWKRFTYGGDTGKDQRVYYFNTKEILNNKFGTANPIMFEVVNKRIGMSRTVQVRCNGVYTYVISDPLVFYSRLCGNVATEFTRDEIDAQLKVEFVDALQPALGALAEQELRPAQIPAKANELKAAMNDALKQEWIENRGISVAKIALNPITLTDADMKKINEIEDAVNIGRRCNADRRGQLCRRNDGLHGHGHGRHGRPRRFRRGTEPLQHGAAADAAASADAAARTERLEMQLRCNGNGQILPRMRRKETRTQARRRKLEMQLRCNGNGQILPGVRRKETRTCTGRLDLHLRKGQQR